MKIIVYCEIQQGKFHKSSFELLSFARALSENSEIIVCYIGDPENHEADKLAQYGAQKLIKILLSHDSLYDEAAYAAAISQLAKKHSASLIIFPHSIRGKAIAPRLAVKLGAGYLSAVSGFEVSSGDILFSKKVYTGKAEGRFSIKTEKKVLTIAYNSFGFKAGTTQQVITTEEFHAEIIAPFQNKLINATQAAGKILLTDAEIIVSAGRGMKGPENWGPVEELASLLGAATACSRPVSDEGWRPHSEHVGQTGKIVSPDLYIALGISGAIQHIAGISSSKVIVAVNKDPEAAIFQVADYGIVGDIQEVLPQLIQGVKELKNG